MKNYGTENIIVKNSIYSIAFFASNLGINICFTPYAIKHLGIEVYGLVPLINSIILYYGLFTLSLNSSLGRNIAINFEKGDYNAAIVSFNTGIVATIIAILAIVPFAYYITANINFIIKVKECELQATKVTFTLLNISFIISTLNSCISVPLWAKNRFDIIRSTAILNKLLSVTIVILLFETNRISLIYIGVGVIIGELVSLIISIYYWKKYTPVLKLHIRLYNIKELKSIYKLSIWLIINQIGSLLFLNSDMIIVNNYYSYEVSGMYNTIMQLSNLVRGFSQIIIGTLTPIILQNYAKGEIRELIKFTTKSIRILGIIIAIPIGLITGMSTAYLSIWLGSSFSEMAITLSLSVIHLSINLSVLPLFAVQLAYKKVKVPGIATIILGVANIISFILIAKWQIFGINGIVIIGAFILSLKNALFTTAYCAKIQNIKWRIYLKPLMVAIKSTILISILSFSSLKLFNTTETYSIILISISIIATYLIYLIKQVLDKDELLLIKNIIYKSA